MQSRSYLFLLLVLGLGLIAGLIYTKTEYHFGLDVRGGVRLTYQIDDSKLTVEQRARKSEYKSQILRILEQRVMTGVGVVEGVVLPKDPDQYIVELPGFTNLDEAAKVLGTSASIKFYWAKNIKTDLATYRPYQIGTKEEKGDNISVSFTDVLNRDIKPTIVGADGRAVANPDYQKIIDGWDLILQGDDLASASPQATGQSGYRPLMNFSANGARKMEAWSRQVMNKHEYLAAVLDGKVLSIAPLKDNTILSDNAIIEGEYSAEYVKGLTSLLNSGALPVDLKLIAQENEDPTIGVFALNQIVNAGLIAFGIVSLFLIVYYAFPGFVAFIALSLYVLFTLTVLKTIGATFSLAGIAGFILSVGMAVDANILVFERFKEEMKNKRLEHLDNAKRLKPALEAGFKRALPAIIDANACTVLTSIVLMVLGTGPVKGFATTLIIGVMISLFTAVSVTRSLLMFAFGSGLVTNPKYYQVHRGWFGEKFEERAHHEPLKIVENSKRWFWISGLTIIPGLIAVAMGGIKPNVEFRGGYEATYRISNPQLTSQTIGDALQNAGLKGGNVKISSSNKSTERLAIIGLPDMEQLHGTKAQSVQTIATAAGLNVADNIQFQNIGPAIQKETLQNAIMGVIVSSGLIILYLSMRFGFAMGGFVAGFRFGSSAIGALVHDVLVVIGVAGIVGLIAHWEVSSLFITSMLTIIGFSVHDTIVIFDRIREHLRRPNKDEDFGHLVDRSITQSFARSINTSMTVIVTLAILFGFGTATIDLKFFILAMLVGIISGTYSSIYNASPILYLWDRAILNKKGKEKTLIGMALAEMKYSTAGMGLTVPVAPTTPTATTEEAKPNTPPTRTYGQVKRRANDKSKGRFPIDDDLP
ncbi:MAG: protein translocase subunit SecD [Armatimonadetes bacterium]|nr:protein translocase subunit SecD [Armatimonadota bacterium]